MSSNAPTSMSPTTPVMTGVATSADGTPIAYTVHGPADGAGVILVHGALAMRTLQPAPAALAQLTGLRVLEYDRRGRGGSGDTAPYAVEREVEDIQALVDVLGGRVALIGESSGATLALEAARAGVPATALFLYEPPIVADDSRPALPGDYLQRLDAHLAAGRRAEAFRQFSVEGIGMPAEMVADLDANPYWPLVEPIVHTLAYDARVQRDTMSGSAEPLLRFADVDVPTTVLVSGQTFGFMPAGVRALVDVLPDARLVELPDAGHQLEAATVAPVLSEQLQALR